MNECKTSNVGLEYHGHENKTISERDCQRWDSQTPHSHAMNGAKFPEDSLSAAENYCRNPSGKTGGPWCFTTDSAKIWEYCKIKCGPGKYIEQAITDSQSLTPASLQNGILVICSSNAK